ncbi:GNAT family N-acetyltransferase [Methylophaga nitratireducenticrescens]|uniref:Acetyltransferase n=1 Tax=Methylophaga nitratireducenticrescens TaxID=754476 RepID=I1XH20_METNJ|nr:GNAT family N-acetyltransferase [Methylophaga nitratireducenticrescens]AFI83689.1 N-acetyltransferase [Methylophaga nitratireducenticrescens]AUZ83817.1 N-acetyltransferase [Methylophaga nitratireducenticrescens]
MGVSAPTPLKDDHDISQFNCGNQTLNNWLQHTALKNERHDGSRTFVVCDDKRVVGYYTLAAGAIQRLDASGKVRRNMPEPVPVIVLGRLAVDLAYQGNRVGPGLLKDALLRVISISEQIGIKAMLVHAISEEAKNFYLHYGFTESPTNDMTLMITIKDAVAHL